MNIMTCAAGVYLNVTNLATARINQDFVYLRVACAERV